MPNVEINNSTVGLIDPTTSALLGAVESIKGSTDKIVGDLERVIVYNNYLLSSIAQNMQDGILVVSADGVIRICNPTAAKLLNKNELEMIGQSLFRFCQDLKLRVGQIQYKYQAQHELRVLDISMSFITPKDMEDKFGHSMYLLLLRDVTTHAVQLNRIQELTATQGSLLDAAPAPMFYTDLTGHNIRGSKSFFDFLGVKQKDITMSAIGDILGPELKPHFLPNKLNDAPENITMRFSNAYGDSPKDITVVKSVFRDASGDPIGFIANIADASDKIARQQYAMLLMKVLDIVGKRIAVVRWPQGTIVFANTDFNKKYGYARQDLFNKNISEIMNLHEEILHKPLHAAIDSYQQWIGKIPMRYKDGTISEDIMTVIPVSLKDKAPISYCLFVQDTSVK